MPEDARFDAVADNFIYIHRALCHDLSGIRGGGARAFQSDFPRFVRILDKHTELEEQLFFPALEARSQGSTDVTRAPTGISRSGCGGSKRSWEMSTLRNPGSSRI